MKKRVIFSALLVAGSLLQSCEYDDQKLWDSVNEMEDRIETLESSVTTANTNIATLQQLVSTLQTAVTITSVTPIENGYEINFSNGNKAQILNGADGTNGTNGTNAPAISVTEQDGELYWTLDGELMLYNGNPIKASATDAIAPQIRINETSKEWETSVDNGKTWVSTGVVAQGTQGAPGASGDSFFAGVDTSNEEFVTFTLHDGTELTIARYDESAPTFEIDGATTIGLELGKTITLNVNEKNVAQYAIAKPDGWRANYESGALKITAPESENSNAEREGVIAITLVSKNNKCLIVKLNVSAYELRTLTFEDEDAKFTPYSLDYAGKAINTWSDLVDDSQYGGSLTYNNYNVDTYYWYDENNTELYHEFQTPYWGGGHAISNYVIEDYETLPEGHYGWYELQFATPIGGHNGSSNFCVHNGYQDFFNSSIYDPILATLSFADGVERVIDHMYVTNINYVLNSLTYGDGFCSAATETSEFKIVATGYDASDNAIGTTTFTLCSGTELVTTWEKFDLSSLGKVAKVTFNFEASEDLVGSYGMNAPAYFAYDDVAVRF